MYGHSSYGSNKYGGLVKAAISAITYLSKIPSILTSSNIDKNVLQSSESDKHVLKSNNNKTIL